ncbi:MAG: DUF309 domain-containing protein [Oscillochloris sp.]|nr:DUF309 domain-containing protein [Oscillochloris sp.]
MLPPEFQAGVELFNAGKFWHAHEAWEHCWLAAEGDQAAFYQGLIQAAAALVKWQQGNRRGLLLNWAKGRGRLAPLLPAYAGIDLLRLCTHMDGMVAGTLATPPIPLPVVENNNVV